MFIMGILCGQGNFLCLWGGGCLCGKPNKVNRNFPYVVCPHSFRKLPINCPQHVCPTVCPHPHRNSPNPQLINTHHTKSPVRCDHTHTHTHTIYRNFPHSHRNSPTQPHRSSSKCPAKQKFPYYYTYCNMYPHRDSYVT